MGLSKEDAKQLVRNVQERIAADQHELGKLFTQLTTFTNQPFKRLAPDMDKLAMTRVYERISADQRELGKLLKRAAPEATKFGDAGVNSACMATDFAIKFGLGKEAAGELMHLVEKAKTEEDKDEAHHGHIAMPFLSMPTILQRYGEREPEVHIGWADIYLDLILVGVAFNGGLLLKHAFYLCEPADDYHGDHHRLLEGGKHPPCVGLGIGLMHVCAFGTPVLGAWLKETMFRARCENTTFKYIPAPCTSRLHSPPHSIRLASHLTRSARATTVHAENLVSRGLEVFCYLLMIIGASCEEDVSTIMHDGTFWRMFTICMTIIDFTWIVRYSQLFWHPEKLARSLAQQRVLLLLPGTVVYLLATWMA